jgi:hypothetical protein
MKGARHWLALLLANLALAGALRLAAPEQPALSDRVAYEYTGRHGLDRDCPFSVYCYRLLVPVVLEQLPWNPETRWRTYEFASTSLAGFVTALATAQVTAAWQAPLLATLVVQMSFGFTFTAYDPYSPDAMVFLVAALLVLAWISNRPWAALGLSAIGVFAKETVALVALSAGLAAVVRRPDARWRVWIVQTIAACALILGFHGIMDTYAGWGISKNVAAKFSEGSWLGVWLENMDGPGRIAFLLFTPFGFAWLYAILGFRVAPVRLRALALGALAPMLALNYVQNPERALANAFFVVVPLTAVFLSSVPPIAGFAAAVTNGLLTAKVGLSTTWLPSSRILLIPALATALWAVWLGRNLRKEGDPLTKTR